MIMRLVAQVLDVTSGAKFYGVGKTYHQFAGTVRLCALTCDHASYLVRASYVAMQACTRALALSSLKKKDISDDVSDFNEKQNKELVEIKAFYYDKYPTVRECSHCTGGTEALSHAASQWCYCRLVSWLRKTLHSSRTTPSN